MSRKVTPERKPEILLTPESTPQTRMPIQSSSDIRRYGLKQQNVQTPMGDQKERKERGTPINVDLYGMHEPQAPRAVAPRQLFQDQEADDEVVPSCGCIQTPENIQRFGRRQQSEIE